MFWGSKVDPFQAMLNPRSADASSAAAEDGSSPVKRKTNGGAHASGSGSGSGAGLAVDEARLQLDAAGELGFDAELTTAGARGGMQDQMQVAVQEQDAYLTSRYRPVPSLPSASLGLALQRRSNQTEG
jgi:hypothetical protein